MLTRKYRNRLIFNSMGIKQPPNPLRTDPTRTATIRRQFENEMTRRFVKFRRKLVSLIVDEDAFGLREENKPWNPVINSQFSSTQLNVTDPECLRRIRELQSRLDPADVIELETEPHVTVRWGLHGQDPEAVREIVANVFCKTGKGGGVDPSCSPSVGLTKEVEASWSDYATGALIKAISRGDQVQVGEISVSGSHITADDIKTAQEYEKQIQLAASSSNTGYSDAWRGTVLEEGTDVKKLFKRNSVYEFDALTAISADRNIAQKYTDLETFAGGEPGVRVLFRIGAKKGIGGVTLGEGSEFEPGMESILPKGAKYKVSSYHVEDGIHIVSLYDKGDLNSTPKSDTTKMVFWDGYAQKNITNSFGPVWMTIGRLSLFQQPEYDVLKLDVESQGLERLNAELGKLPNTQTHDNYEPHLTIAYLKPGTGWKYLADPSFLEWQSYVFTDLTFSDKERKQMEIMLNVFCPTGEGGGVDPSCGKHAFQGGTIDVWHGGSGKEGKFVTYHTTEKEMAESYIQMYADRFGEGASLHKKSITIDSPAPEVVVAREAKKLGMEYDDYTPASVFDNNLFEEGDIQKLISKLKNQGYDGTVLEDIPYGQGIPGKEYHAYITFTGASKKPDSVLQNPVLPTVVTTGKLKKETPQSVRKDIRILRKDIEELEESQRRGHHTNLDALKFRQEKLKHLNEQWGVTNSLLTNVRWSFRSSVDKIKEFLKWLERNLRPILTDEATTEDDWWNKYVQAGFKKGAARSYDDMKKAGAIPQGKLPFYLGQKDEFLKSAFRQPESVEKVKLLAGRVYMELKGVTEAMSQNLTRTLTDGLVQGMNPRQIATNIVKDVNGIGIRRARVIARTEIIRAHSEGQLDALERLGVKELRVMVEWSTAGDSRVCPLCQPLEGIVLTMDEAKGLLPRHPQCRCAWSPANVGEDPAEQVRGAARIKRAITKSLVAGKPKRGKSKSSWAGARRKISKSRPKSLVGNSRFSVRNVFCKTGAGGGIDPSCSPKQRGVSSAEHTVPPVEKSSTGLTTESYIDAAKKTAEDSGTKEVANIVRQRMERANEQGLNQVHADVVKIEDNVERLEKRHQSSCDALDRMLTKMDTIQKQIKGDFSESDKELHRQKAEIASKLDAQAEKVDKALSSLFKARRERTDKALKVIKDFNKDGLQPTFDKTMKIGETHDLPAYQQEAVTKTEKMMRGLLHSDYHGQAVGKTHVRIVPDDAKQRAYFTGERHGGDHSMFITKSDGIATVAHEFGHAMETNDLVHFAAKGFLYHRVGKEAAKPMGQGYEGWEVGMDDDFGKAFSSPRYVGKFYKSRDTEIISMGMEKMLTEPVHFAKKDPEYFKFMVGVMSGTVL